MNSGPRRPNLLLSNEHSGNYLAQDMGRENTEDRKINGETEKE